MLKLEVIGKVEEITYRSEKSCKFTIIQGSRRLLATITLTNIDLVDSIEVGKTYKFKGCLNAYTKTLEKGSFIDNVFYVSEIEKGNDLIETGKAVME